MHHGGRLLSAGQPPRAIRIFEPNVGAYPTSSNVHDSLGEVLAAAGDVERAVASYRRAVDLGPGHLGAASVLAKMEGQVR